MIKHLPGFLSTADEHCTGNWGLKDQVAALKWVKNNIAEFSGDNGLVTLFGQNSGGSCVHLHLLSPLSKGLFHRAISQSATALNLFAKPDNELQRYYARQTAIIVGCGNMDTPTEVFVDCLRKMNASQLVESVHKLKLFDVEPLVIFGPVLEGRTVANPRPFIDSDPMSKIVRNEFSHMPWMVGVVEREGIIRAASKYSLLFGSFGRFPFRTSTF